VATAPRYAKTRDDQHNTCSPSCYFPMQHLCVDNVSIGIVIKPLWMPRVQPHLSHVGSSIQDGCLACSIAPLQ